MSEMASSGRAKRSRTASNTATAAPRRAAKTKTDGSTVSAERRRAMIAESAYYRAAERGFEGGDPVADWLASEREVDVLLAGGEPRARSAKSSKNTR